MLAKCITYTAYSDTITRNPQEIFKAVDIRLAAGHYFFLISVRHFLFMHVRCFPLHILLVHVMRMNELRFVLVDFRAHVADIV